MVSLKIEFEALEIHFLHFLKSQIYKCASPYLRCIFEFVTKKFCRFEIEFMNFST